jgi:AraC-like DNA-binding protein
MDDRAWDRWLTALTHPVRGARVTYSAFSKRDKWAIGARTLPDHMIHYVVHRGHAGTVGGHAVRTHRNDILWVPAGVEHDLRMAPADGPFTIYSVRFAVDADPPPGEPPVRRSVEGAYALFARLIAEDKGGYPGYEQALRALIVLIFNEWRRAARSTGSSFTAAEQVRLARIIDADPSARIQPARLARELGLAPKWFARRFRRTYGLAPRAWLVRHRIGLIAQRLAENRQPIGRIASEYGYPDVFLFSRQFKAVMGCSPRTWRGRGA